MAATALIRRPTRSAFGRAGMLGFAVAVAIPGARPAACTEAPRLLRQIVDRSSGARWLLLRDPRHPAGPALLIPDLIPALVHDPVLDPLSDLVPDKRAAGSPLSAPILSPTPPPVVRAGDRVLLEEHTAVVDAQLEAIALGSASAGQPLRVRLLLGGRTQPAVALGPGRVRFDPTRGEASR